MYQKEDIILKQFAIFLFFFICLVNLETTSTFAQSLSKEEITNQWSENYRSLHAGNPYIVKPDLASPQVPGELDPIFLNDGLRATNFVRYLTGLPANVQLTSVLNNQAQHGAVLLAVLGYLSHTPAKPDNVDEAFYQIGYNSTSTSNIAAGFSSIADSIINGYMEDGDLGNISRVGHRRWVLNPSLQTTGFGFAENKNSNYGSYTAMQVINDDPEVDLNYDYIAFPSAGNFPLEFFNSYDPWSVSLNPKLYQTPSLDEVSVKLTRLSDSSVWNLDKKDNRLQEDAEYFNIDYGGYGDGPAIIFRAPIKKFLENDQFKVEINGVKNLQGQEIPITYTVTFFNMIQSLTVEPEKVNLKSGETLSYKVWMNLTNGMKKDITQNVELTSDYTTNHSGQLEIPKIDWLEGSLDLNACYHHTCTSTIINIDNVQPLFSGVENKIIYLGQIFNPKTDVTAEDNVDGNITGNIEVSGSVNEKGVGKYPLLYSVKDQAGNQTTIQRIITVKKDTVKPKLYGIKNKMSQVNRNFNPKEGITATDNVDGNITENILISGQVNIKKAGKYTLTYTIKDTSGNITTKKRVITVR